MSTASRSKKVLDVALATPPRFFLRVPCSHGFLRRLVTTVCEKCGLIVPLVVLVVGIALAFGRHESAPETKPDVSAGEKRSKLDAAGEMSEWLLNEGEKRLVASDPKAASDAARLAAFFGESDDAVKLLERASPRLQDARTFLREGKRVQAFASLFEAIEKDKKAGEAELLLDELKKSEAAHSDTETKAKPGAEDEALKNFREGVHLKESGDLIGAREKLELAQGALQKFAVRPSFSGAILDAHAEVVRELEEKYLPKIGEVTGKILKIGSFAAAEKARALFEIKSEIKEIVAALPENGGALRLADFFESEIRLAVKNWTAAALAAENLSGCERAGRMYEDIVAAMPGRNDEAVKIAMEGKKRCDGRR